MYYGRIGNLTAAMAKDRDGILCQIRNFRLSPGMGAVVLNAVGEH